MLNTVSSHDRARLRALAQRQAALANSPEMAKLYEDWRAHGRFAAGARPMITVELLTFADEIIPSMLECEGDTARGIEARLLGAVIPYTMFGDDTPIRNHFPVSLHKQFVPFGLSVRKEYGGVNGYVGAGHRFIPYLEDIVRDWHLLGKSRFSFNLPDTQAEIDWLNDLFGDILPAKRTGEILYCSVAEDIIHVINMEGLYMAMLDEPDHVHRMVDMLIDDYHAYLDKMEEEGLLLTTAGDEALPAGSFCFTDNLPQEGERLMTGQVWGYMDAEEMNDVSADMYREFIVDHYKRLTGRFGALSFGCCEAIHRFWEDSVETLPNLRKVSVSAWCDDQFMGERLRGKNIVFLKKPTANLLGVHSALDETEVARYFGDIARAARGCRLEITQRDVYLLHGNIDKVRQYVHLQRAAVDKYWAP